jgi:uncharacterized membrane protein YuzA (DUF378 family)
MQSANMVYLRTKFHMVLMALVLVGALNWGTTVFGYNIVEMLSNQVNKLIGSNIYLDKVIYIVVALAALRLAMKKTTWLPFLGYSAFPSKTFVPNKEPKKGNTVVEVKVRPNTRVAYWASSPKNYVPQVEEAYGDFSNSGVVTSNNIGVAKLVIEAGTSYIVPSGREINRHIHYRELDLPWGMMGDIKTRYY